MYFNATQVEYTPPTMRVNSFITNAKEVTFFDCKRLERWLSTAVLRCVLRANMLVISTSFQTQMLQNKTRYKSRQNKNI